MGSGSVRDGSAASVSVPSRVSRLGLRENANFALPYTHPTLPTQAFPVDVDVVRWVAFYFPSPSCSGSG